MLIILFSKARTSAEAHHYIFSFSFDRFDSVFHLLSLGDLNSVDKVMIDKILSVTCKPYKCWANSGYGIVKLIRVSWIVVKYGLCEALRII